MNQNFEEMSIVIIWNYRCPNQQKPCSVLYNQNTDRLETVGDADESMDTDDGPVSLSGILK